MEAVNKTTMGNITSYVLLIILGFCTDFIFGRSLGAPPSACTSNLTPSHGYNPQTSTSPFIITPDIQVYGSTTQRVSVTLSWPSNIGLKGLIMQAQRVSGSTTPVGTWSIGSSDTTSYKLIRCDHDGDTISHRNSQLKTSGVTFGWHPPSNLNGIGDINFVASFVKDYATYWILVKSEPVVDPCIPSPCQFGGQCNRGSDTFNPTFTCTCPSGLTGSTCNSCDSNPCQNQGICTASAGGFSCTCPNGFTGELCQTDLCSPSQCLNSGVCQRVSGGYECICINGFTGTHCQESPLGCVSGPCKNSGQCFNGEDGSYFCQCTESYTGMNCEQLVDACNPSNPCQNNATCAISDETTLGFLCECTGDWVGTLCEQDNPCIPNPCYYGSTCLLTNNERGFNCDCLPGYTGNNCETPLVSNPCDSDPCQSGGTCYQSADALSYFCTCLDGYTGTNCETLDPCHSAPCLNAGVCNNVPDQIEYHCTCSPIHQGKNCEITINPCDSLPCLNNGQCSYDINGFVCSCGPFHSGARCEVTNTCISMPCQNGGSCTGDHNGFTCQCATLYSGTFCEKLDFNPCTYEPCSNGVCTADDTTFTCDCALGWTGVRCDEQVCTPGTCQNGGTCSADDNIRGYSCACPEGYIGLNCETSFNPCQSSPCFHSGTCTMFTSVYGQVIFTCQCLPSYTGTRCENLVNPCMSDPCLNGGTCSQGNNDYTCQCPNSHTGVHCQTIAPCGLSPCNNGGQCRPSAIGTSFTCTCQPPYAGVTCDIRVNLCDPNPCSNNGDCQIFNGLPTCFCDPPYTGERCTDMLPCHSAPCQNGGICTDNNAGFTCTCPNTHTGLTCETQVPQPCDANPCQNGGRCQESGNTYQCFCSIPFTGSTCSDLDRCLQSNPCVNQGTCNYVSSGVYTCTCPNGYTGMNCQNDPCYSNPCQNSGVCAVFQNGYACTCQLGWLGTTCTASDTTCSGNICMNGGTCRLTAPQQYQCDCAVNYSGTNCETFVDACSTSPCKNSGTCEPSQTSYTCICPPMFTGMTCETSVPDPCIDNGDCVNGQCFTGSGGASTCVCDREHSGPLCETNVCTKKTTGCQNNGRCDVDAERCNCATGFSGIDCTDTVSLPPTFNNCPEEDLEFVLEVGTINATIFVQEITARDSSGLRVPVREDRVPEGFRFNSNFQVSFIEAYRDGFETIVYAQDFSGARSECVFRIKLIDNEVPIIECPAEVREVTTSKELSVLFDDVVAVDNLGRPTIEYTVGGQETPVSRGHLFPADDEPKTVIATAKDSFDNEASCAFTLTVFSKDSDCSQFPDVANGDVSCGVNDAGIRECSVSCHQGYSRSVPDPQFFTCKKSTGEIAWQPAPKEDSICAAISPGKFMKVVSVIFEMDEEFCSTSYEQVIITDIIESLSSKELCTLNSVNACNRDNYDIGCRSGGNNRRRRAITDMTVGIGISAQTNDANAADDVQSDINLLAMQIMNVADSGQLLVEVDGEMVPSREDSSSVTDAFIQECLPGQMAVQGGCVSCQPGTFYNDVSMKCEFCDADTYQDDEEQTQCNACPEQMFTDSTGAYALALCKDKSSSESIWTPTLIAVIGAAGGLVVLLIFLILILCCCRLCCSKDDEFSDSIGNLTHLNKAYEEEDDEQEMTFTGTMDNGRASVRTYQSIPVNGFAHHEEETDDRLIRIPSMSASVYQNHTEKRPYMQNNGNPYHMTNGRRLDNGGIPESSPPPPPVGAPAPPPPPPPPK